MDDRRAVPAPRASANVWRLLRIDAVLGHVDPVHELAQAQRVAVEVEAVHVAGARLGPVRPVGAEMDQRQADVGVAVEPLQAKPAKQKLRIHVGGRGVGLVAVELVVENLGDLALGHRVPDYIERPRDLRRRDRSILPLEPDTQQACRARRHVEGERHLVLRPRRRGPVLERKPVKLDALAHRPVFLGHLGERLFGSDRRHPLQVPVPRRPRLRVLGGRLNLRQRAGRWAVLCPVDMRGGRERHGAPVVRRGAAVVDGRRSADGYATFGGTSEFRFAA